MGTFFCRHIVFFQQISKLRSGTATVVLHHFPARYQQYATRGEFRFQHPETLPQQPSCPIPHDRKQTVFFAADYATLYFAFRCRSDDHHHAGTGILHTFASCLIKLGFETQFITFIKPQAYTAAFRHSRYGHFTQNQAVSRARPF